MTETTTKDVLGNIRPIDTHSVHKISSGQVVIDLQTAVKELVENSLDAGATNIEVRFRDYGLDSIEVIDNGSGIAPSDYDAIALKHHTSKLDAFEDLASISTFGFRGEALSSICALSESVTVTTAIASEAPMGTIIELDRNGTVTSRAGKIARQRGTTVSILGLFKPLPVRRKELERNAKREFGKALTLLNAYALVPCAKENRGVRLTCTNQPKNGKKTEQLRTSGSPSTRSSVSALWGPKALDNLVDLDLSFHVETEKSVLRRQGIKDKDGHSNEVRVCGLISKFTVGGGRTGTDRQFFFVNGRPYNPSKVQKAFNEVYRTFNANQSPFIIADFTIPTDSLDINVSPDKRTIFIHSENNLIQALKIALEEKFSTSRSTYDVNRTQNEITKKLTSKRTSSKEMPLFIEADDDDGELPKSGSQDTHGFVLSQEQLLVESQHSTQNTSAEEDTSSLLGDIPPSEIPNKPEDHQEADVEMEDAPFELSGSPTATQMQNTFGNESMSPTMTQLSERKSPPVEEQAEDGGDEEAEISMRGSSPEHPLSPNSVSGALSAKTTTTRSTSPPIGNSARSVSSNDTGKGKIQMVLSTSNASWKLRRSMDRDVDVQRPAKRPKTNHSSQRVSSATTSKQDLWNKLLGFARSGSQVTPLDAEKDEEEEEEERTTEIDAGGVEEEEPDSMLDQMGVDVAEENLRVDRGESRPSVDGEGDKEDREPTDDSEAGELLVIDLTQDATSVEAHLHSDISKSNSIDMTDSPAPRQPEIIRTTEGGDITMQFNLSKLSASWRRLQEQLPASRAKTGPIHIDVPTDQFSLTRDAGIANTVDNDTANEALSRVIDKTDFSSMRVIGQFNKGFIVTRRRKICIATEDEVADVDGPHMDDLFIVDQHAADEKYNFERLQQTTRIESQRLFRPEPLELTASDELLATENIEVLHQNGFEIEVNEDTADQGGHRLRLVAQPVSKSTSFDMKDLEELLHLMHDHPKGHMVRCTKARAMFAMRACRSSVMVGMPLKLQQMISVVRHMGVMNQPWNCPHGRPTMRHLSDIVGIGWRRGVTGTNGKQIVNLDILADV